MSSVLREEQRRELGQGFLRAYRSYEMPFNTCLLIV
jgi:hypothetical protein